MFTLLSVSSNPGISMIRHNPVQANNTSAYASLVAVEFLHDGQHLQHKLQAALPKQHASCDKTNQIYLEWTIISSL